MAIEPISLKLYPASPPLDERSKVLRRMVIDAMVSGGRGHLGSSLSMIEIFRTLYDDVLRHNPADPHWPERDRAILSKGHGCLALYAVLADHGYFSPSHLSEFCHPQGILGGHPERHKVPGAEASTGALGHGLAIGVGMALAQRMRKRDSRVFVVLGDGEINEGSVWEAAMHAAKHKLDNLTAIIDYNKLQSYGATAEVLDLEPLADKWRAFSFETRELDGHDVDALREAFGGAPADGKPRAFICHTVKGKGIPFAENEASWHHKSRLPKDKIDDMYAALAGGVNADA